MMRNLLFLLEFGRETRPSPLKSDPFSLATAGASLIGSLLGFQSQSDTNRQQIALAREQMAQQRDENQLNRDFQERMWNEQNEYNTPSAMMQRYEDAGLNPFMVGDNSGIGQASSVGSPSSVSQGSVPNLQAPKLDLATPAALALQSQAVSAEVANNESVAIRNIIEASKEAYKVGGVDAAQEVLDLLLPTVSNVKHSPMVQQFLTEQKQRELDLDLADFRSQIEQRFGYQKAERAMEVLQTSVDKMWSEIDNLDSQTLKNVKEMDEILSKMALNYAHAANLNADTKTINESRKAIVNMLTYQADMAYFDKEEKSAEFANTEGVRLFKRTAEAKRKRLEAEVEMNPLWNKRVAAVNRFREATGFSMGAYYHGSDVRGNYTGSTHHTSELPPSKLEESWTTPNVRGGVNKTTKTRYAR